MKRSLVIAIVAASASAASSASAQSKRYPPDPVDKDQEAAEQSKLWDKASNPNRKPYEDLLAQAAEHLAPKTTDGATEAVKLLDDAVKLLPDESRAYRMRGEAHTMLKDWTKCAADLVAGTTKLKRTELDARSSSELRKKLGICQARAGQLGDAERTLAETAASGAASGEVWMRLGEVRIALGKLEEAIAALEAAQNTTDVPSQPLVKFLLAGAHDRSRRPSDAARLAQEAVHMDRMHTSLRNPNLPLITQGEAEYLLGLAYSTPEPFPRGEHALVYFRQFLKIAPDSPWRKRAEDKIRELKDARFPEIVQRAGGNADVKLEVARDVVRKGMPALRACMARLPTTVFSVTVTKAGPRTPASTAGRLGPGELKNPFLKPRPTYYRPSYSVAEGITTLIDSQGVQGAPTADTDAAIRCIEPLVAKMPLPKVRERDAFYRVMFYVVGP